MGSGVAAVCVTLNGVTDGLEWAGKGAWRIYCTTSAGGMGCCCCCRMYVLYMFFSNVCTLSLWCFIWIAPMSVSPACVYCFFLAHIKYLYATYHKAPSLSCFSFCLCRMLLATCMCVLPSLRVWSCHAEYPHNTPPTPPLVNGTWAVLCVPFSFSHT